MKNFLIYFILILGIVIDGKAQDTIRIDSANHRMVGLAQFASFLPLSPVPAVNIQEILQPTYQSLFKPYKRFEKNERGFVFFSPDQILWTKLWIKNNAKYRIDMMFNAGFHNFSDVYFVDSQGNIELKRTGQYLPASQKDIRQGRAYVVRLHLEAGETKTVYVRSQKIDHRPHLLGMDLIPEMLWIQDIFDRNWIEGLFHGILLIMVCYNLLIFATNQDKTYLYYALYIFNVSLYFLFFRNFTSEFDFLLAEYPTMNMYLWTFALSFAVVAYYQFMRYYLETQKYLPKLDKVMLWAIRIGILIFIIEWILIYLTFDIGIVGNLSIIANIIEAVVTLFVIVAVRRFQIHNPSIRYFVIGSLALWFGGILGAMTAYFTRLFTLNALYYAQVGVIIEILFFSLGLGVRMKNEKEEKLKAQESLIDQLKENERMQLEINTQLEKKVVERTAELNEANEELTITLEQVQFAKYEIEKKNEDIRASITYAQRIQSAMLPTEEEIKLIVNQSFILFKPRDIVSGDFYYFAQKEDKIIISAIDCTGHGVPGAFMSMIGNDLLNQIIHDKEIHSPELILNELHKQVRKVLKQQETLNRDGMDLSIVIFDQKQKQLIYAGAMNPLYYVSNYDWQIIDHQVFEKEYHANQLLPSPQLFEIKADKKAIGGQQIEDERLFTKHIIDLKNIENLTFYLCSDGYQDQFGGDKNKKFMARRFKELLLEIHQRDSQQQKQILEQTFETWKGNYEQIDDVLVIGMKIKLK
jgi:serine phosphatase RsbU (regulator of sigma subunit)